MKTHISRKSFDVEKRYAGVYQQMGRMLTDADWNELSDIDKSRLSSALTDVIGSGTPRGRGLVVSRQEADGSISYALGWGHCYVDGIGAQVRPARDAVLIDPAGVAFEYQHQADFPAAPALPVDYRLYVDVWERTVTALEDADLIDPGLHGADTCTRLQTMGQVKWCEPGVRPEDAAVNPAIGDALLTLELRTGSTEPDPCDPCAEEIELQDKVGNYLFRVEIHDVVYHAAGTPERVTLKWSSENGAEQYVIDGAPKGFESDRFCYEFFDGAGQQFASEKHLGRHLATGFSPARGELLHGYPDPVPVGRDLVRRWDGFAVLEKSGTDWVLVDGSDLGAVLSSVSDADAHGHVTGGVSVTINLDAITATVLLGGQALLAGDFWQAEVRQAVNVAGDILLTDEPPCGIQHHYMLLGDVVAGVFTPDDTAACQRFEFPPLTDIRAENVCYDNDVCDMPDVDNVQEALDYLCQQKDLRWHHKHLHGWGIVCGLIVECCEDHGEADPQDGPEDESGERADGERTNVCVTAGHALTCEGETLSLAGPRDVAVMNQINLLEESGKMILNEKGDGTVCLRLDPGADGEPVIRVEPYDANARKGLFDGTLLMDFYQDCILGLVVAIREEASLLGIGEVDEIEGGATGLVSPQRRRLTSLLNLGIQLIHPDNGSYVFLSFREHEILRAFYLRLRDLIASKTFCGMFQANDFPEYPFPDSAMTTFFGKNSHSRILTHPSGETLYTYGGTDNTINVYSVAEQCLVNVLEMPVAEGAEVSALAIDPERNLLYAAASVRQTDTVFGIARIGDDHKWEDMSILCDVTVTEMVLSPKDPELIYMLGLGSGLFFVRPALFDGTKPKLTPTYQFNASGHMRLDFRQGIAYCTASGQGEPIEDLDDTVYDRVAICDLARSEENQTPQFLVLQRDGADVITGSDGIEIATGERSRLYVVVDGSSDETGDTAKGLMTYADPAFDAPKLINIETIEDTGVALAFHEEVDVLLLSFEDGYRAQVFDADGRATNIFRVPVQIQPVDIRVGAGGDVYVLNYGSNTVSSIPAKELDVGETFLENLADYRTNILRAFYALAGGILQYLKDCFCHHLLVKCPTCRDEDVLYLGTVEIRERQVYNICNFDKRKYVKTFDTVDYWKSIIPIAPVIGSLVSRFCCLVLPDFFDRFRDRVIKRPGARVAGATAKSNAVRGKSARTAMRAYQRTDGGMILRESGKSFSLAGGLLGGSVTDFLRGSQTNRSGVKKTALLNSKVDDATAEMERNGVIVTGVEKYETGKSGTDLLRYNATPGRIAPGSRVKIVEKEGRVLYYALEEDGTATSVPEKLHEEINDLETRKSSLADLSQVEAKLASAEARKVSVGEIDAVSNELARIQSERATAEAEVAQLNSQVVSIKSAREEEERQLAAISRQRATMSADIEAMNRSLNELEENRKVIAVAVETQKPVANLAEVDAEMDAKIKDAGLFTLGDLASASEETLIAKEIEPARARVLIRAAKERLEK